MMKLLLLLPLLLWAATAALAQSPPLPGDYDFEWLSPTSLAYVHNNADLPVVVQMVRLWQGSHAGMLKAKAESEAEGTHAIRTFRFHVRATCHGSLNSTEARGIIHLGPETVFPIKTSIPGRALRDCAGSHMHLNLTLDYCSPAPWGSYSGWTAAAGRNPDLIHCDWENDIYFSDQVVRVIDLSLNAVYVVLSSISALVCLAVIWLHLGYPELRRFPNGMVFWRTVCDLGFAALFIWSNANTINDAQPWNICNPVVAFLTQFFLFASLGWFMVLALNTYFSISNPFRKPSSRMASYHAFIWSVALGTAFLTSRHYDFRPDFQICWIRATEGNRLNLVSWVCMFAWMIVSMVMTGLIMVYAHLKLRAPGLNETLQKRREILRQSRAYVIVFSVYWMAVGTSWYVITKRTELGGIIQERWVAYVFAVLTALTGVMDSFTWLALQRVTLVRTIWGPRHTMARLLLSDLELWQARQFEALELYEIERGRLRPSGRYMKKHQLRTNPAFPPPPSAESPLSLQLLDTGFFVAQDFAGLGAGGDLEAQLAELQQHYQFDDISAALRQEFIVAVTEGILECSTVMFRRRRKPGQQPRSPRHSPVTHSAAPGASQDAANSGSASVSPPVLSSVPSPVSPPVGNSHAFLGVPGAATSRFNHKLFAGARAMSVDSEDPLSCAEDDFSALDDAGYELDEEDGMAIEEREDTYEEARRRAEQIEGDSEDASLPSRLFSKLRRKISRRLSSSAEADREDDEEEQARPTLIDLIQYDPATLMTQDGGAPFPQQPHQSQQPQQPGKQASNRPQGLEEPLLGGSADLGSEAEAEADAGALVDTYYAPEQLPASPGKPIQIRANNHEFRAFAPKLFRYLRTRVWGWSREEYTASMTSRPEDMVRNFSEGASGSFLWKTADEAFRPKTLDKEEFRTLLRLLPAYARHMARNPESLIIKIYGLYSIRMYSHTAYVMVMENVLRQSPAWAPEAYPYRVHEVYDLKGSWINRHAKPSRKDGYIRVFKDNDFKGVVRLGEARARRMRRQLLRDTRFLQLQGIMDYSLLLGIHNCAEPRLPDSHCGALQPASTPTLVPTATTATTAASASKQEKQAAAGDMAESKSANDDGDAEEFKAGSALGSPVARPGKPFDPLQYGHSAAYLFGPGIYHVAIIDILQSWTLRKRVEQWLKRIFWGHWSDWEGISSVDPMRYQRRFMRMVQRILPPDALTADAKGMDWR